LGGSYSNAGGLKQIINTGLKIFFNASKVVVDAASFAPFLGIAGKGTDVIFSAIDTSILGSNLIKACNKLPKNQQFFKTELEKFNYVLSKMDKIKSRLTNNNHHTKD
jgi:hypothetical protein